MIRLNELKMPLGATEQEVMLAAAKALKIKSSDIKGFSLARRSIDSRKKDNIFFVYNVSVEVDADENAVARCNMFLRTADRVYITLGEFPAFTFDELFDGVASLPFEDFMPSDAKVLVDGKCVKSKLFAVNCMGARNKQFSLSSK